LADDATKHTAHIQPKQRQPPVIAFGPAYLADALAIGSTLRLIDGLSPGMAVDPSSGNFCVLMPCRCVAEAAVEAGVGRVLDPAVAA